MNCRVVIQLACVLTISVCHAQETPQSVSPTEKPNPDSQALTATAETANKSEQTETTDAVKPEQKKVVVGGSVIALFSPKIATPSSDPEQDAANGESDA